MLNGENARKSLGALGLHASPGPPRRAESRVNAAILVGFGEETPNERTGCWSELDLNFRDPSSLRRILRIFDYRAGSVMGAGLGIPRKLEVTVV